MDAHGEIRILHSNHMPSCSARVDKRFVGYCTLQYITRGAVELSYGGPKRVLEPEWLWPTYPGPRIRFHLAPGEGSWDHRYVAVAGPGVERWRAEGLWPNEPQAAPDGYPTRETFDRLLALAARGDPWGERRAVHLLADILLALAEARGERDDDWFQRARALLDQPEGLRCDLAATAAELGVSPATFRRRFRAAGGMSPREYAMQVRLERARGLLLDEHVAVAEVARALGYRDAFLFSRQFKARFGLSPSEYRATRME